MVLLDVGSLYFEKFVKNILLSLSIIISLMLMSYPALAAENTTSTINITIEVAQKTIVVVDPDSLSWTGSQAVEPGREGVVKAIQIENMGSTNITYIWANTTYESSSPFGTGNASLYDAGNFVAISKTNETGDYFFFVNRVDYNETHLDIYLTLPANTASYGRFRDGGSEYFWAIVPGTNCTDGTFYIGKQPHTENSSGSTNLVTCDGNLTANGANPCRSGSLTAVSSGPYAGNWGYADLFVGPNSNYHNYTVAVSADCSKVMFYHWNMDAPGAQSANHPEYLYQSTLYPGGAIIRYVKVKVAYGTAAGNIKKGYLTIIAQSQ